MSSLACGMDGNCICLCTAWMQGDTRRSVEAGTFQSFTLHSPSGSKAFKTTVKSLHQAFVMLMSKTGNAFALPLFFVQNDLPSAAYHECLGFVRSHWSDYDAEPIEQQGACSWTLLLCRQHHQQSAFTSRETNTNNDKRPPHQDQLIVQFRRAKHAINISIATDARRWYPSLAPICEDVGSLVVGRERRERLQVCRMSVVEGVRASEIFRLEGIGAVLGRERQKKLERLMGSLACCFARTWSFAGVEKNAGRGVLRCEGRVGKTVLERLGMLEGELPLRWLRLAAGRCRRRVEKGELDLLPVVLTHGDLIPSNILVDEASWELRGLVDWAEAEYLPFGMSLYCVDHLLGKVEGRRGVEPQVLWQQYAEELRLAFWSDLKGRIPALHDANTLEAVSLARDVGVLLWHGVAFDDGKIDRVVVPGRDDEELACLSAFLDSRYNHTRACL